MGSIRYSKYGSTFRVEHDARYRIAQENLFDWHKKEPTGQSVATEERHHFYAESRARSTTTETVPQTKVGVTFAPDASAIYYILWCALVDHDGITADCNVRCVDVTNSVTFGQINEEMHDASNIDEVCGVHKFTASGSPPLTTFEIQWWAEAGTAGIAEAKIFVIQHANGDQYAELAADSTTTLNAFQDHTVLTWTPASQRDYLVFYSALGLRKEGTTAACAAQMDVDGAVQYHVQTRDSQDVASYYPWGGYAKINLSAAQHTLKTQWGTGSGSNVTHMRNSAILALDATNFANNWYAESLTRTTTTSGTFQDKVTLTQAPAAARNHLIVAASVADSNSLSQSVTQNFIDATTPDTYSTSTMEPQATSNRPLCGFRLQLANLTISSKTWKIQWLAEGGIIAGIDDATISLIDLGGVIVGGSDVMPVRWQQYRMRRAA